MKVEVTFPAEMKEMPAVLLKDLKAAARRGLAQGVQLILKEIRVAAGGEILQRRTGNLARSFYGTGVEGGEGEYTAHIGSKAIYASIHEDGGTIRPVKAKALAIPFAENLTPRGVPRYPTPADLKAKFGKATFLLKRDGKAPLIVAKTGKKKITPFFVLAKEAKIPATHYLTKSIEAQADTIRSRIATEVFVAKVTGDTDGK
jgi:phage gpG-like protein